MAAIFISWRHLCGDGRLHSPDIHPIFCWQRCVLMLMLVVYCQSHCHYQKCSLIRSFCITMWPIHMSVNLVTQVLWAVLFTVSRICSDVCLLISYLFSDYLSRCTGHFVLWSADGVPYDGRPFIIVGRQQLECRHGPLRTTRKTTVKVINTMVVSCTWHRLHTIDCMRTMHCSKFTVIHYHYNLLQFLPMSTVWFLVQTNVWLSTEMLALW